MPPAVPPAAAGAEADQYPHFAAHLFAAAQKARRPTGSNRALSAAAKSTHSSSAWQPDLAREMQLRGTGSHTSPSRHSCSSAGSKHLSASSRPAARAACKRPASAAPSLLVTAHGVRCAAAQGDGGVLRPLSAALVPAGARGDARQQQQQQRPASAAPAQSHAYSADSPCRSSAGSAAPVWQGAQVAPARPTSAHPHHASSSSNPANSCLGQPTCRRPSSPLGQAGSRHSRPSSTAAAHTVRPGSRAAGANNCSSSSPWAAFGRDAPVGWQWASSAGAQWYLQQQQRQSSGAAAEVQPAAPPHTLFEQAQETQQQQQQQVQACCHHQTALQLFRQLPLSGPAAHASVLRESLQQMALGLQLELQRVGAPLDLCLPAEVVAMGEGGSSGTLKQQACRPAACWVSQQVAPELQLWQQLSSELCRQTSLECSERGQLLQAATDRQRELTQQALTCCDRLCEALLSSAASHQQEHEDMLAAQHEAQTLQQDNTRLKALLESKQAQLVATAVELEQQQERMRRGRFSIIHAQVQEARMEIEKRMLRDMEAQVHKARAAAEEAAAARQAVLLSAVEQLAGQDVAAAVLQQLEAHEARLRQQQPQTVDGGDTDEQQETDSVLGGQPELQELPPDSLECSAAS